MGRLQQAILLAAKIREDSSRDTQITIESEFIALVKKAERIDVPRDLELEEKRISYQVGGAYKKGKRRKDWN